jgi:CheY-like chemotaxis protein
MKILLVEDSDIDVEKFTRLFGAEHEIVRAKTAAEAVAMVDDDFDLVVCDYCVPGAVENALVDVIKSRGFEGRIAIVSGSSTRSDFIVKDESGYRELAARIQALSTDSKQITKS